MLSFVGSVDESLFTTGFIRVFGDNVVLFLSLESDMFDLNKKRSIKARKTPRRRNLRLKD